jgi:hypothetical protein
MESTSTEYAKVRANFRFVVPCTVQTKHVDAFMGEPNLFLLFGFLVLCSLAPTFVPVLGRRVS